MATINNRTAIDISSLKKNKDLFNVTYDKENDILLLQVDRDEDTISVDCEGIFWLRVNPQTGEILGVEIEGYRKVFLKLSRKINHDLEKMNPTTSKPFVDKISKELNLCLC
ncbi:hypothetical protein [Dehalococcoides mccartyi]|jgi:hypothetical protein|uniref:hypothetical protein n=1 Tax=Dehalococcoides mccartyi TaxID=61435 RepID=UPI00098E8F18|nr:hypothetical protein [Dehalococcoides mccartyi]AQU02572.1 hypothetical protein B1773_00465 [Dehalococcoides mccartyi]AQU03908.1 hypothetical protein B1774_00325 [Dehalococcoides mccartyi]